MSPRSAAVAPVCGPKTLEPATNGRNRRQVYERVQGLRRQAYDSSDYLEGLNAFAEKRPPMFRGA